MTENIVRKSSPEMRSVRTENANAAAIISVTMLLTHKRPASRFCRRLFIGRASFPEPRAPDCQGPQSMLCAKKGRGAQAGVLPPLIQLTRGGRRGHSAGCSIFFPDVVPKMPRGGGMASMKRTGLISMLYRLIFHQLDFAGLLSGDMEIFFVELAIFGIVYRISRRKSKYLEKRV